AAPADHLGLGRLTVEGSLPQMCDAVRLDEGPVGAVELDQHVRDEVLCRIDADMAALDVRDESFDRSDVGPVRVDGIVEVALFDAGEVEPVDGAGVTVEAVLDLDPVDDPGPLEGRLNHEHAPRLCL